jgi:hypothetical protein
MASSSPVLKPIVDGNFQDTLLIPSTLERKELILFKLVFASAWTHRRGMPQRLSILSSSAATPTQEPLGLHESVLPMRLVTPQVA